MLFKKIEVKNFKGSEGPSWVMIIRDLQDLTKYMNIEQELFARALFNIPVDGTHVTGHREKVIQVSLQTAAALSANGTCSPIDVTSKLVQTKMLNMMKMLDRGDAIQVNRNGGYCDEAGFIKIWEPFGYTVLTEIEKDSIQWPSLSEAIDSDIVFMENDEHLDQTFYRDVRSGRCGTEPITEDQKRVSITRLKEVEPAWLFTSLCKTKTIAFCTQYVNRDQAEQMFQMFLKIPSKKTFIIRSTAQEEIQQHSLYSAVASKHNIIWI